MGPSADLDVAPTRIRTADRPVDNTPASAGVV